MSKVATNFLFGILALISIAGLSAPVLSLFGFTHAQSGAGRPTFEAVSIKPTSPDAPRGPLDTGINVLPGGKLKGRNVNLKWLITVAFSVSSYQVSGNTDLMEAQTYNLDAEASGPVPTSDIRLMLQSFLQDQFKLKLHRETRDLPVYSLVVVKNGVIGPGLVESEGGDCAAAVTNQNSLPNGARGPIIPCGNVGLGPDRINGRRGRIAQLADRLSSVPEIGRTVIDNTGLTGLYDIRLQWSPMTTSPSAAAPDDSLSATLFTAIQEQLGLKLQAGKGPVEVIVVDSFQSPAQ